MTRNYPRLSILDFGNHLLDSGDLDPIYIALHKAKEAGQLDVDTVTRWMIAYWCFYHAGVASYLSELTGSAFWDKVMEACSNTTPSPVGGRWPRGKERRHFRGMNGYNSVADLRGKYPDRPESMLMTVYGWTFSEVSVGVQKHSGFGPWIAWKVGDMLERVHGMPISFDGCDLSMYRDPTKAAGMLYEQEFPGEPYTDKLAVVWAIPHLQNLFGHRTAPPVHDRPVNVQELETILCKWKSHQRGHYPLNNDLHEIREGVTPWIDKSYAAWTFLHFFPHATN